MKTKRYMAALSAAVLALTAAASLSAYAVSDEYETPIIPVEDVTTESDSSASDSSEIDTSKPDSSEPDSSTPDTSKPDTTEPDTRYSSRKFELSNPNADDSAKRLYAYICDNFGEYMLSGQQELNNETEMDYIYKTTGKYPAIRGFDFMNNAYNATSKRARDWAAKGGIVSICWHTGTAGGNYDDSKNENPDFDKLLTEGTDEYNAMIKAWDKVATALKNCQNEGVAVLWRPFHEFDGGWFWWGKGGAENFKKLWRMQYKYFTEEKGLNNLIWVLGYADDVKDEWYPGDEYVDIIGSDTYRGTTTHSKAWDKLLKVTDATKPLTFHETGKLPTIEEFEKNKNVWSWFLVWHSEWIMENNDPANLKALYNSDTVITLDELPDLKTYSTSAKRRVNGDVNNDDKLDVKDVIRSQKYINGDAKANVYYADVNLDNEVTVKDVIRLQKMINGDE